MGHQAKVNRDRKKAATKAAHGGVCVAFIHPGETSAFFTTSMLAMMLYDGHTERNITGLVNEWSSANVSAARNKLAALFVDEKPDADWLLFIDADMGFEHDALERLLRTADPVKAPIVGGLCFGANADRLFPTIYSLVKIDERVRVMRAPDYERNAVVQCVATGSAFLLIHRRVLEAMRDANMSRAFPWFQETELDGDPVGEDITFCLRAGKLGFPVFVDTRVKVGHHKSHLLTEALFDEQRDAVVGLTIPTLGNRPESLAAIIKASGLPRDRVCVVNTSGAPLEVPGATVVDDVGDVNIHRWWNRGIDWLAARGCTRVAAVNDDAVIEPRTLPALSSALDGVAVLAAPKHPMTVTGWCWMLDVSSGVRPDESYRWWFGDNQLWMDAHKAGGVAAVDCGASHRDASHESTPDDAALAALADADEALFRSRHPLES